MKNSYSCRSAKLCKAIYCIFEKNFIVHSDTAAGAKYSGFILDDAWKMY